MRDIITFQGQIAGFHKTLLTENAAGLFVFRLLFVADMAIGMLMEPVQNDLYLHLYIK